MKFSLEITKNGFYWQLFVIWEHNNQEPYESCERFLNENFETQLRNNFNTNNVLFLLVVSINFRIIRKMFRNQCYRSLGVSFVL